MSICLDLHSEVAFGGLVRALFLLDFCYRQLFQRESLLRVDPMPTVVEQNMLPLIYILALTWVNIGVFDPRCQEGALCRFPEASFVEIWFQAHRVSLNHFQKPAWWNYLYEFCKKYLKKKMDYLKKKKKTIKQ